LRTTQAIERLAQVRAELREEHGMFPGDPLAEVGTEWEEDVEELWRGGA
jgi:hypothetical protein